MRALTCAIIHGSGQNLTHPPCFLHPLPVGRISFYLLPCSFFVLSEVSCYPGPSGSLLLSLALSFSLSSSPLSLILPSSLLLLSPKAKDFFSPGLKWSFRAGGQKVYVKEVDALLFHLLRELCQELWAKFHTKALQRIHTKCPIEREENTLLWTSSLLWLTSVQRMLLPLSWPT